MDECLWMDFLEKRVKNIHVVLATVGIHGLLQEYTAWLQDNAEFCKGRLQRRRVIVGRNLSEVEE